MGSAGEYANSTIGRESHSYRADCHTEENFCGAALLAGNKDANWAIFGVIVFIRRNARKRRTRDPRSGIGQRRGCDDRGYEWGRLHPARGDALKRSMSE